MDNLFPEIKIVPCESKKDAFALINQISAFFEKNLYMKVSNYYALLELEPIPEEAYHYCWLSVSDFNFCRKDNLYYIQANEPVQIVDMGGNS